MKTKYNSVAYSKLFGFEFSLLNMHRRYHTFQF